MSVEWVINRISATQLSMYKACPRKWFYRYVMGKKHPATPAMQMGTDIHTDFEQFLTQEIPEPRLPESRYVWLQGLIPPVEKVYAVEIDLSKEQIKLCDGAVSLMGYLDLVWFEVDENKVYVWDWKTRSRFDYAPSAEQLQDDIQAILYSYGMFVHLAARGFDVDTIVFAHMNILREDKGGPDHKYVETVMTREYVETIIATRVEPQIYEMNETAKKSLEWVQTHKTSCFMYGRCEHFAPCRQVAYMGGENIMPAEVSFSVYDLMPQKEGTMSNTLDQLVAAGTIAASNGAQPQPITDVSQLFGAPAPAPMPQPVQPQPQMAMPGQYPAQPTPQAPMPAPAGPPSVSPVLPAAPHIMPPDAQPDIQPASILDQTVDQFDWSGVDLIGAKGEEKIKAHLREKGFTHMSQLMHGFDFKSLPTVGEKGAQNIRIKLGQGVPFDPNPAPAPPAPVVAPDGQPLAHNEFIPQPDGTVLMSTSAPEPTPEEWLQKAIAQFDATGIIPPYAATLPDALKQQLVLHVNGPTEFRPNNPDYAPPAPAAEPPTTAVIMTDDNGRQAAESVYVEPLLGVTHAKVSLVVGECAVEMDLQLDPAQDARPAIERAMKALRE
jgi:CRISPR/Cas system-associated exonuclease Cas4 (RecB family)